MADFGLIALGAAEAYTDKKISQIPIPKAWLGNTTTALSEGSTANPITIDNEPVTAESGNIAAYDDTEYIFTGTVWQKFGGKFTDLTDVNVSSPTGGQIIRYNGTSGKYENSNETTYENKQAASGGTDVSLVTTGDKYNWDNKPSTFAGLTDTNVVSPGNGQYIKYDTTSNKYVNGFKRTVLSATLAAGATTVTFTDSAITNTALYRVFTDPFVEYDDITQSGTTITVTFEAQQSAVGVKLVIEEE